MFSCFTIGQYSSHGAPGGEMMRDSKLKDLLNGSEYVLTYEDRDGDWMLVGDVPLVCSGSRDCTISLWNTGATHSDDSTSVKKRKKRDHGEASPLEASSSSTQITGRSS